MALKYTFDAQYVKKDLGKLSILEGKWKMAFH
jgi:hypothetical protein